MKVIIVLLVTIVAWVEAQPFPCEVSAKTEYGIVCGLKSKDSTGGDLASFLSIPYAKPPLGKLRFAEAQKLDPFPGGYFNATTRGPVCPQTTGAKAVIMSPTSKGEDCLHLNVYTPLATLPENSISSGPKPLLPVLVFVHGGGFSDGSGDPDTYGPEFLMPKGIVLVTFNYRLNVFGFLSLNSKYIPGNNGLRDTYHVLKWVHKNINNFGGNPDEVTLGGISAGACIAHLVSISPAVKDKGYIKKVLLMSGTGIGGFFSTSPLYASIVSTKFLQAMNISIFETPKAIHQALVKAPIEKIMLTLKYIQKSMKTRLNFVPVIESEFPEFTTIIPKDPERLLNEGYGKDYPLIVGFTNNECIMFKKFFRKAISAMQQIPILVSPPNLVFTSHIIMQPLTAQSVIDEYFGGGPITMKGYLYYCSDMFYKYPAMRVIEKRQRTGAAPTFMYEFGYEQRNWPSLMKHILKLNWTKVAHTEEFVFIFRVNTKYGPVESDELERKQDDDLMRIWISTMFADFVKFGDPTPQSHSWPPAGKQLLYLDVHDPNQFDVHSASPRLIKVKKFFDTLYRNGRWESYTST